MNRDVHLEIEGGLLEKLLCRALDEGAEFAEVRRISPRRLAVYTDDSGAQCLLGLCERYRLNCAVRARGGRPALWDRLRARWTLTLGCLLCMLLCFGFFTRLWRIDVVFSGPAADLGNRTQILAGLEDAGLYPGMPLAGIDTDLLQKRLMADCGPNSFVGVRLQGIRLLVEAAPEVPSPALYDRDYARDLVAARDAVVVSVNVRSGTACVKAGDTVRAGQTLIRGEEEKTKEETVPVAALGEVIARCWFEGSAEGSLVNAVTQPTGKRCEECSLKLLGLSLPLTECAGFESEEQHREVLPVVGLYLPLEIERIIHIETTERMRNQDADTLEAELSRLARAEAMAAVSRAGAEPRRLSVWEDCTREDGLLRVRAVAELQTDIAVTRDSIQ